MSQADIEILVGIVVDGRAISARAGSTVAAAMINEGLETMRRSVGGESRGVLCGMGVCQECRVTIDGVSHRRACATYVAAGMRVERGP